MIPVHFKAFSPLLLLPVSPAPHNRPRTEKPLVHDIVFSCQDVNPFCKKALFSSFIVVTSDIGHPHCPAVQLGPHQPAVSRSMPSEYHSLNPFTLAIGSVTASSYFLPNFSIKDPQSPQWSLKPSRRTFRHPWKGHCHMQK